MHRNEERPFLFRWGGRWSQEDVGVRDRPPPSPSRKSRDRSEKGHFLQRRNAVVGVGDADLVWKTISGGGSCFWWFHYSSGQRRVERAASLPEGRIRLWMKWRYDSLDFLGGCFFEA